MVSLCMFLTLHEVFVPNEFTIHNFLTLHYQKTLSSNKDTVFPFTRISLYTIHLEKQKSCKVRATRNIEMGIGKINHC